MAFFKNQNTKKVAVVFSVATMIACSSVSRKENSEQSTKLAGSVAGRAVAAERIQTSPMENRFQAIITSQQPEQAMIDHVDRLYHLLISVNQNIQVFDHELDQKLAIRRRNPNAKIEEPLDSKTYSRLLKMWVLSEKYHTEISYFFLRLLESRTDENATRAEKMKMRKIQQNLETYLANTQDSERIELQKLMLDLKEIFNDFVKAYRAAQKDRSQNPPALTPSPQAGDVQDVAGQTDQPAQPSFEKALFGTPEELQNYISTHRVKPTPQFSARDLAKQAAFQKEIDRDLGLIADPKQDRRPQSQDLNCGGNKKLCINPGEDGNIIGAVFPKGVWAFTYDDGPAAKSTGDLMELIHNYRDNVNSVGKATFFWLAKNAPQYPQWVSKGFEYGFSLQNHSFSHANLNVLDTDGRRHEVNESNRVLLGEFQKYDPSYNIQYFRCPYGSCYAPKVPEVRQMIADQGQIHAYWRIDSLDWKLLNGPQVADLVIKQIQLLDHGVILMHDIHPTTVEATRLVLEWLKDQNNNHGKNYRMVTIPEAVDLANGVTH